MRAPRRAYGGGAAVPSEVGVVPRDEKRRQKSLQRKAVKRKQRGRAISQTAPARVHEVDPAAASWPLHECLISRGWQVEGEIVQILVARRSPVGQIAAGVVLVDLACLGVKDAFGRIAASRAEYEQDLRAQIMASQPLIPADLNLAAKVIREAVAYARRWGFNPHPDFTRVAPLFAGADPDASAVAVPLGIGGKPHFIAGPSDDPRAVIDRLTRTAGEGNFDFTVGIPAPAPPRRRLRWW